jgi:1-deoxy-D-xylulose-5-phosphate reductoisomerase
MNVKGVAVLGSTGSIGTQALGVIEEQGDRFNVVLLTANNNYGLLIAQAKKFKPDFVVIVNDLYYKQVFEALNCLNIKVFSGIDSICSLVAEKSIDIVLTALVGYSGLKPTMAAITARKKIALANKESLVVAGEIITSLCKKLDVDIYPVDSEHSAIFQCLTGEKENRIEKIILTASGGPFRKKSTEELCDVTLEDALKHPNWDMGAKITIDSATLMNKGLEVIEAGWLFGLTAKEIEVVVHPQSIIHSAVQFQDGSIKAQLGVPDMKLPIQYALGFPKRLSNSFDRFSFFDYPELTFEKPKRNVFRSLDLAYKVLEKGGNAPCVLNAANEVAVNLFLSKKIGFLNIFDLVENCVEKITFVQNPTYEDLVESNYETINLAKTLI